LILRITLAHITPKQEQQVSNVKNKIDALIDQAKQGGRDGGISKTRAVFSQLERIDEALRLGIKRQALADSFGWTLGEFEGAYRRAQQLKAKESVAATDKEKKRKASSSQPKKRAESGIGKSSLVGDL
jgi:hypothetical protein